MNEQQKAYSFYSPKGSKINTIYEYVVVSASNGKMTLSTVNALSGEQQNIVVTNGLLYFSDRAACVENRRQDIVSSYAVHENRMKRYKEIGINFELAFPEVRDHSVDDDMPPLLTG